MNKLKRKREDTNKPGSNEQEKKAEEEGN